MLLERLLRSEAVLRGTQMGWDPRLVRGLTGASASGSDGAALQNLAETLQEDIHKFVAFACTGASGYTPQGPPAAAGTALANDQ